MTRMRTLVTAGIALSLLAPLAAIAQESAQAKTEKTPVYLDPARLIDERVDDLVGRMTLEEKVSQMTNSMQAIPRLQVPAYNVWSEALHGVAREGIATVFPEPIGMAATFDAPLLRQTATVTGLEGRVKFNEELRRGQRGRRAWGLTFFAPNVNIFRDPRWGRGQETYGEDPYLSSRMAVAFVTGLQGDDPDHLTAAATAKHYVVHSGPEPLRHQFDAVVSKHDLEDTYLPAFRAAVVEGKVQAVMCAYNAVNGVPACASEPLLEETLRKAWSFGGFVTGDCDAVDDIHAHHKYVKTAAEAAAVAVKAGTDNDCVVAFGPQGVPSKQKKYLEAVQQGLLSEADLTQAVKRVMRDRFELGLFDPPESVNPAHTPDAFLDSFANRELAARVARESMVLLKNDGVLPLPVDLKKIAVVGPLADSSRVLLGNYNGTPSRSTTALAGIEAQFPEARITFEPGTSFLRPLVPVPASALSTADGAPGLTAEVFESFDFTGSPLETRVDPGVQFGLEPGTFPDFGNPPPPPKPTRWSGFLTAPETGTYTLGVEGFGNRLFLDGKKLVDTSGGFPPPPNHVDIELEKGKRYAIKVEALPRFFASTRLSWLPADPNREQRAVDAARDADVVVAVVGITSDLEGEELRIDIPGFEGGDRTAIGLPEPELQLLKAVQATGKPLVVVLMSGSALAVNWSNQHANAILEAWYPGEEGGTAIAEVLAGAYNPAGRLPITIYKGVEQLPPFTDYSMANRTYRYFDGQPLFPFGYGLSYSKFAYSNLSLSKATLAAGDPLEVAVDVKNTSDRAGDEVVQLYLTFPKLDGVPRHALRGFSRVHLRAGETRSVKLALADRDLSYVNADGTHMIGAGTYQLSVGGGQPGTGAAAATATFTIKGDRELPR